MDSDRNGDSSESAPKDAPCRHVWTQLTPITAQCDLCQFIVPTVPAKE